MLDPGDVEGGMALARALCVRARTRLRVDPEDLLAAAYFGLARAMRSFDPARRTRFSTWATVHIWCEMAEETRRQDHLTRWQREHYREAGAPAGPLSPPLSLAEVAAERFRGDEEAIPELCDPDADVETAVEARLLWQDVERAIQRLPARWQLVIRRHCLDEGRLDEVATELGVTPSRVWQIEKQALERLRRHLGAVWEGP